MEVTGRDVSALMMSSETDGSQNQIRTLLIWFLRVWSSCILKVYILPPVAAVRTAALRVHSSFKTDIKLDC